MGAKFMFLGKVYTKIGKSLAEEVETRDARTFPDEGRQAEVSLVLEKKGKRK